MRGEWVAMRRESSASKRVSFGSTVLIPSIPSSSEDTYEESDEDGSLDPEELFGADESDEGSITLEELVLASEHSFCALHNAGDEEVARRISQKLCKKLAKAKVGSFACPFSDLHDSTDVTYSESETDVVDPGDDEDLVLRRLDASFSPKRMKGLLGSGLASKFASLRTFASGDELSLLTLETSDGGGMLVADSEFEQSDPDWLHPHRSTRIRPPSQITPEKIQAAKRKLAIRAAQKAASDVGASSSVLR